MQIETPPTGAKSRLVSPYVAVWTALAAVALAYLAVLVVRPELIAQVWPGSPPSSTPETNEGQRADTVAEMQELKSKVDRLESDVSKLKTDVDAQSSLTQGWEERISVLETKAEPAVAANAKTASPPMKQVAAKPAAPAAKPVPGVPGVQMIQQAGAEAGDAALSGASSLAATAPTAPAAAPAKAAPQKKAEKPADAKTTAAPAASAATNAGRLETGTLAFAPPVVSSSPATAKPLGVVVGSGTSVDSLRLSWSLLADRNEATLGKLVPRYIPGVDANGLTYDLVAGPVTSAAEANKLCKDLQAKAIPCRVSDYTGEAF